MKILVTGGTGMVGNALKEFFPEATFVNSTHANLQDPSQTTQLFASEEPDVVIHLAARVGGIKDNSDYIYDYFLQNLKINTNVVDACKAFRVPKLIAISSTCVYPAVVSSYPITEDMLHNGYPEKTNYGYAFAKRMMQVQMQAVVEQECRNWSIIYCSNLYGPFDTFDLQKSHVAPALMLKFHFAKAKNLPFVELYGTGKALRQLTYVRDLALQISKFVSTDVKGDYNFANPQNYSIAEVANVICNTVGYEGKMRYNGLLDGVMRKDVSIDKISKEFKIDEFTGLENGMKKTYNWFLNNKVK